MGDFSTKRQLTVIMNYSMQDYLKIVTPHLRSDLVSPEAFSHIQSLAQIFPSVSLAGMECRLGETQSRVDFQVSLPRLTLNLPQQFLTHRVWQFFQEFCQEWTEPTSFLYQGVERIWMEFDLDGQQWQVPLPCIFLQFNQETVIDAEGLSQMAQRLFNHQIPPLLESNIRRCADSLPIDATISHLGAMLSRPANAVRVNVRGISPEQLSDYLMQIGWSDPTNTFSTLTSTLSKFVDSILLSVDVGDTVLPRIGLECFLDNQLYEEPRWELFLDYLVEEGLCAPAKKNSLLNWPGFSQKSSAPDLWPSNISFGDRLLGSRAVSLFYRWISHIKLVYQSGIPLEAKGYLAFCHSWFERNALLEKWQKTENSNLVS
ncbi:MAG: hypothetical protein KME35_20470 [Aphanocapsa sp. GSE-SYN-MK-11-07L]|jgi:hypothetical protein|nr:hypothetical protein [Aphanocapsa sp. GSE-SYN-MK-11-07L]